MGVCGSTSKTEYKKRQQQGRWNQTHGEDNIAERETKLNSLSLKDEEIKPTENYRKEAYRDRNAPNKKRNSILLKNEPIEVEDHYIQENFEKIRILEYSNQNFF